jgi:hypothetical protein
LRTPTPQPILTLYTFVGEARLKQEPDGWEWRELSFAIWRGVVDRRLKDVYLIDIDDAGIDDERLTSHWEMKQPPYEFVEWFAIKYDLDPKSQLGL